MHGRILVIDPIATNRIVLRVKLAAAHFEVLQADGIADAVRVARGMPPDAVLTASELPDGDAAKLIRRLDALGRVDRGPVMAILGREDRDKRLRLVRAGVDEVMTRPLDDAVLIARLRSLVRTSSSAAEWQLRDDTTRALGFAERTEEFGKRAEVVLVDPGPTVDTSWARDLSARSGVHLRTRAPAAALDGEQGADAYVLALTPENQGKMLPLVSAIRSLAATRHSGILVIQPEPDAALTAHTLDLGAGELVEGAVHPAELALRLDRLIARKEIAERLRATVKTGLEAAVSDPLTGLHNRRYALPHLARIAERSQQMNQPFAVLVADMDHFKQVNDRYGHAAGDAVLIETAQRLRDNVRAVDMVARIGGEEFLIVLPGTSLENAQKAAGRLCRIIRDKAFDLPEGQPALMATISIGMTVWDPVAARAGGTKTVPPKPDDLLECADRALYKAKAKGRNRVLLDRPAA